MIDLQYCKSLDAKDPLRAMRDRFARAGEDTVFMDGNSIGAMPADAPARVQKVMIDGWRDARRRGWNRFDWLEKPWLMGEGVAHILGAGTSDVIFSDNTSVNLYKILGYAWQLDRRRPVIVTETWNFPTDMYVAEGLVRFAGGDAAVRRIDTPDQLEAALTKEVGVLYLSHVDYRSSRRWDMAAVNRKAAALGIVTLWDCSHSAGAVAVDLAGSSADFAVGCGYKYLCGGPGSPAWLYVHPRHQDKAWPVIAGWMGHEDLFAFAPKYAPVAGVRRHLTGTPGIIANEAMAAAIDIWKDVKVADLSWKHRSLSETLIQLLEEQCGEFSLRVTCPREYEERGGAVIFSHPGAGSVTEALLEHGVVSSFRKHDSIRFGVQPLALSHADLWTAVARLRQVLESEVWRDPKFAKVSV